MPKTRQELEHEFYETWRTAKEIHDTRDYAELQKRMYDIAEQIDKMTNERSTEDDGK